MSSFCVKKKQIFFCLRCCLLNLQKQSHEKRAKWVEKCVLFECRNIREMRKKKLNKRMKIYVMCGEASKINCHQKHPFCNCSRKYGKYCVGFLFYYFLRSREIHTHFVVFVIIGFDRIANNFVHNTITIQLMIQLSCLSYFDWFFTQSSVTPRK